MGKGKRKRFYQEKASEIIDLTNDKPDQPTSKKFKTNGHNPSFETAQPRPSESYRASTSADHLRWIQMGWKPGAKSPGAAPTPSSLPAPVSVISPSVPAPVSSTSAPVPVNSQSVPTPVSSPSVPAPISSTSSPAPAPAPAPIKSHDFSFPSSEVFSHPSSQFRQKFRPDPAEFRAVAASLCVKLEEKEAVRAAGNWHRLTVDIVRLFNNSQQERRMLDKKIDLWTELYKSLHQELECGLAVSGSTFNGFGGCRADLDMCLYPHGPAISDKYWLNMVRKLMRRKCRNFIRGDIELINAKVPILKFHDTFGGLEVDMSVNNPTR